jgi:hypothetical protein
MYKIIILILSSNSDFYDELKRLQLLYLNKYSPFIKFFFIEFKEGQKEDIIESNNTLYFRGTESITPGMIIKTSLAINYLKNKYDYDFIFRTNLSTLINIHNLYKHINSLPKENICSGFVVNGFITGTGIIMPKNVAELIAANFKKFDYLDFNEDVIISQMFSFFNINYIIPINYIWGLISDINDEDINQWKIYYTENKYKKFDYLDNIMHYRIKNRNRDIDLLYFKDLLKKIYDIQIINL